MLDERVEIDTCDVYTRYVLSLRHVHVHIGLRGIFRASRNQIFWNIYKQATHNSTYDHRSQNTDDPVRSRVLKLRTGRLVLRWVTTGEYRLLYVLLFWQFEVIYYRKYGIYSSLQRQHKYCYKRAVSWHG